MGVRAGLNYLLEIRYTLLWLIRYTDTDTDTDTDTLLWLIIVMLGRVVRICCRLRNAFS